MTDASGARSARVDAAGTGGPLFQGPVPRIPGKTDHHPPVPAPLMEERPVKQYSRKKDKLSFPFIYTMLMLILLLLLVTATYTWFSISRTPRVSNIGLYVNAPAGMVLSTDPDSGNWVRRLDYAEMVPETSPLRPVTWSEQDQRFYAAVYGSDGRRTGQWNPLTDEINANRDDAFGYYVKATFYATTDASVKVSLTHAMEVEEGVDGAGTYLIGTPVWDAENILHSDGGNGAQTAIRVGLRVTPMVDGVPAEDQATFIISEPNCDTHVDGTTGYVDTPSMDGGDTLISPDRIIRQTTTTWTEAYPVEHDVQIKTMGQFENDTHLFDLDFQKIVRIELYVWLEGQDVDCDNRIGHEAKIMANIQFLAEPGGQSGLEPIPTE